MNPEIVEVTQEDREAAWPYAGFHCLPDRQMRERWFSGYYDMLEQGYAIRDFARHRQAALTAARPAIMGDQWQPIETAPRDGTAFVGSNGKYAYRTKLGQYYIKWPHEDGGPTYREEWNAEDSGSIWPWKPTHWQPLPAPPVKP